MRQLGLPDAAAYQAWLAEHPEEWMILDDFCRISISRFYRDREVFEALSRVILPELAARCVAAGKTRVCVWSAGCASGEEPYSVSIAFGLCVKPQFASVDLSLLATDTDPALLRRAEGACYGSSSLKDLPPDWREVAFEQRDGLRCLRPEFRRGVEFALQDVRRELPSSSFHLILCRNLVFTYFDDELQRHFLQSVLERLESGGYLVLGSHEQLPADQHGLVPTCYRGVYCHRRGAGSCDAKCMN